MLHFISDILRRNGPIFRNVFPGCDQSDKCSHSIPFNNTSDLLCFSAYAFMPFVNWWFWRVIGSSSPFNSARSIYLEWVVFRSSLSIIPEYFEPEETAETLLQKLVVDGAKKHKQKKKANWRKQMNLGKKRIKAKDSR